MIFKIGLRLLIFIYTIKLHTARFTSSTTSKVSFIEISTSYNNYYFNVSFICNEILTACLHKFFVQTRFNLALPIFRACRSVNRAVAFLCIFWFEFVSFCCLWISLIFFTQLLKFLGKKLRVNYQLHPKLSKK